MLRRLTEHYIRWSVRFWPILLLLALVLTVPALKGTIRLFKNIDTDLANLLPDSYPSVQLIHKVRDKMSSIGNMTVMLESSRPEIIKPFLEDLVVELRAHPMILEVEYRKPGYDFFDEHKMLFVDLEDLKEIRDRLDRRIQREKLGDLYISFEDGGDEPESFDDMLDKYKKEYSSGVRSPFYESDDGEVFFINIKPSGSSSDFKFANQFYGSVRQMVESFHPKSRDPSIQIYFAGSIRTRVGEYKSLMKDLARAGYVAGIGVLLLLMLVFRGPRPILMVLIPLFMSILYTFGITGLFLDGLNTVTAFMFAIMMGLGIDFGIHMVSRYLQERSVGVEIREALFATLYYVGRASGTAAVTTATAFFLLVMVDFKGFAEFGLIAGIGIITSFVTYWLMIPVWLAGLELFGSRHRPPVAFLNFFSRFDRFPRARLVFGLTAGLTLLSLFLLPRVGFEYDYGKLRAELPQAELARDKEQRVRQRRPSPAIVFINGADEAEAVRRAVDQLNQKEDSLIDRFASMYSLVPDEQKEKLIVMAEMDEMLEDEVIKKLVKGEDKEDIDEFQESLHTKAITLEDVPQITKEKFIGNREIPGTIGLIMPKAGIELHDGRLAIQFASEVQEIETPMGTFEASSDSIIFANVLTVMLRETRIAIPLAFLGVLLLLIIDFRSLRKVIAVVVPWISGVIWMTSAMVLLDLKLNFYNVFIPAAVFGMGIDYSVHLFHRYLEDPKNVIPAIKTTGGALVIAALTTMTGFSGLAFANHRGLQSMGLLAIFGIAACMICSLTMLPAGLELWYGRGKKVES